MKKLLITFIFLIILIALSYQASAGCGRWVIRDNTDYLEDPLFDALTDPAPAQTAQNASAPDVAPAAPAVAAQSTKVVPDLSGKWSLKLIGGSSGQGSGSGVLQRIMDIILVQSSSSIQGYGSFVDNGTAVSVTATGSLDDDLLTLSVRPVTVGSAEKVERLYRLSLKDTDSDKAFQGGYELYLSDDLIGTGNATAIKSGL